MISIVGVKIEEENNQKGPFVIDKIGSKNFQYFKKKA